MERHAGKDLRPNSILPALSGRIKGVDGDLLRIVSSFDAE